jgi:hypothetical protein
MNLPTDLLTYEFKKLTPQSRRAVYRFLWRVGIVIWIFWAMGMFAAIGVPGFARATEVTELRRQVAELKSSTDISARINLANEIRLYQRTLCAAQDKDAIERVIERLQTDYERLAGSRYPDRPCPSG